MATVGSYRFEIKSLACGAKGFLIQISCDTWVGGASRRAPYSESNIAMELGFVSLCSLSAQNLHVPLQRPEDFFRAD